MSRFTSLCYFVRQVRMCIVGEQENLKSTQEFFWNRQSRQSQHRLQRLLWSGTCWGPQVTERDALFAILTLKSKPKEASENFLFACLTSSRLRTLNEDHLSEGSPNLGATENPFCIYSSEHHWF